MTHHPDVVRFVTDIGKGDFVLLEEGWREVYSNTAEGVQPLPRRWEIELVDGRLVSMWEIRLYAKQEDFDERW